MGNKVNELKEQIRKFFVGKEELVDNLLICLFTGGHVLLEDVPGVGKTTLATTLAKSVDCDFGRIQCTPDTLPTDIMGSEIFNMKTGEFEYRNGEIMHQIVLVDEINRTSPKTQSSLLEAMSEGQTTVGGKKYDLPSPFMVIATQNPVEFMGTYPLPEAQMDRFMMKLSLGYPSDEEEIRMAKNVLEGKTADKAESVISSEEVMEIRQQVSDIKIQDEVISYIREIINATRNEKRFVIGASPRAFISLIRASQGKAFLEGRDYVKPDDVKKMLYPVLGHRLVLSSEARRAKESIEKLLNSAVIGIKVPH